MTMDNIGRAANADELQRLIDEVQKGVDNTAGAQQHSLNSRLRAVPAYMGYLIIHLCWKISVPVKTRDFLYSMPSNP